MVDFKKNDEMKNKKPKKYRMKIEYYELDKIFVVTFPELPGCMAHGKTKTEAKKLAEIIKKEWLELGNK